ncbi:hypothetical protein IC006_0909 [Sulfuracidifex tepidarius]|uniref:Transglutaminase-like domain-containing protein n=2 Tax=Sulfuracidifex tepidarius TaxID=1294262 RepID=A0A510DTU1_9CREN|nr:hypothetical protein IC006_0909 [Sulfuracidifex tepidarius]
MRAKMQEEKTLLSVTYKAVYEYESVVLLNDNIVKIVPYPSGNQRLIHEEVGTEPEGHKVRFTDSFGNINYRIKVTEQHTSLVISSQSKVEVRRVPMVDCVLPCRIGEERYLFSSDLIDVDFFSEIGTKVRRSSHTLDELIRNVVSLVRERMEYEPGSTYIDTEASKSFKIGKGVCQDFAHVTIGILRASGVPARYVMGLVDKNPKVTHAWVEFLSPAGWVPIDPTRGILYDIGYVKFAVGRDYNDTPPIKGSFISSGKGRLSRLEVKVDAE